MTERATRAHLLPSDATPAERAVALVDTRLDDIDAGLILEVLDPATCPAALLPYLAWQRSVDVWDAAWPEATKRAVIAAAPLVHAHKGTRRSIEAILGALQVDADFAEWFEQSPPGPAYTFKVRAFARARLYDGPLLDARLIGIIHASILRTKPLSRAFDLTVGAMFPRPLGVAAVATGKVSASFAARPTFAVRASPSLGVAGIALAKVTVRRALAPTFTLSAAAPLGVAGVVRARVVVRRSVLLRS